MNLFSEFTHISLITFIAAPLFSFIPGSCSNDISGNVFYYHS